MKNYKAVLRLTGIFFMLIFFFLKFGPFQTKLETAAFWMAFSCFFVLGILAAVNGLKYYVKS